MVQCVRVWLRENLSADICADIYVCGERERDFLVQSHTKLSNCHSTLKGPPNSHSNLSSCLCHAVLIAPNPKILQIVSISLSSFMHERMGSWDQLCWICLVYNFHKIVNSKIILWCFFSSSEEGKKDDVPLAEFMYLVFTHMPGESSHSGDSGLCCTCMTSFER